jgi:hypothetical protein
MVDPEFYAQNEARRGMVSPLDSGRVRSVSASPMGFENEGNMIEDTGFENEINEEDLESPESPPLHEQGLGGSLEDLLRDLQSPERFFEELEGVDLEFM